MYDVVIVGGGPAGLSAALVLGRSRRNVLLVDAGNPRNARSEAMHGFLSRDGTHPGEFLRCGREELVQYGVEVRSGTVLSSKPVENGFEVSLLDDSTIPCRKLLLATGVVDRVPSIEGIEQFYGRSVHHCPYCDGWEYADASVAVYGRGRSGFGLAIAMKTWTQDVVLCSDGASKLNGEQKEGLAAADIRVYEAPIKRLEGDAGKLQRIVFRDGSGIERRAMFFSTGNVQRSALPQSCGCSVTSKGAIKTTGGQRSTINGIWVCGDAAHDSQYVIVAAAHGARAAMAINKDLQEEEQAVRLETWRRSQLAAAAPAVATSASEM
ncbi:MAG TPA: NAD(P)/FAD-dependent oxidoreductase [Bryobacteraceae bacterium]|nr:NAD(P)/FAD-dependent oxidoreductase [Bryobacteraceae bacterium]